MYSTPRCPGKLRYYTYGMAAGRYKFGPFFICKKRWTHRLLDPSVHKYVRQLPGSEAVLHRSLSLQLQSRQAGPLLSFLLLIPTAAGDSNYCRGFSRSTVWVASCSIVKMVRDDLASLISWDDTRETRCIFFLFFFYYFFW